MEIIALQGHKKEGSGKVSARKIRRDGMTPAVMYKSGGGEAVQFNLDPRDFRELVYSAKFRMVDITLDGKMHKCILKALQFHPVTDTVIHLDFLELVPGKKFKLEVPIRFEGTAPGVKAGGKFLPNMRSIKIIATPENVVDAMTANISNMELGSTIRVRDISPVEGIEIINTGAVPIASIEIPRALKTAAAK
ncbi:MAG: 50S ribosomal protein L25 [Lewinellaceae bacterium]|nr:50S ribosomal protein L25 [Lewinellaceae bacterium]